MKTPSKLMAVALLVIASFFTIKVKAQTTAAGTFSLGVGLDAGLPTGNLRIGSNFVLGGTANIQYGVSNSFAITLTSGADHFFSKINPATNMKFPSFGVIPVKLGIKEFFAPHIYFGAETGVGVEETGTGAGNTKFILSPAVGYADKHWDLGVRYENYAGQNDNYGFVALRLAYGFAL